MGEWDEERDAPVAERLAQVTEAVTHASDLADAYWLSRPNFVTVADIRDLRAAWLAERARVAEAHAEVTAAWEALGGDLTGDLPEAIRQLHGHLAKAREERDAALGRVAAMEAVLAEPTTDEENRLAKLGGAAWARATHPTWQLVIRAILADLRQRAGVTP